MPTDPTAYGCVSAAVSCLDDAHGCAETYPGTAAALVDVADAYRQLAETIVARQIIAPRADPDDDND